MGLRMSVVIRSGKPANRRRINSKHLRRAMPLLKEQILVGKNLVLACVGDLLYSTPLR